MASCEATFAPGDGRAGQLSISDPLSDGDKGVDLWNLDDFTSSWESDSLPLEPDLTLLFSKWSILTLMLVMAPLTTSLTRA